MRPSRSSSIRPVFAQLATSSMADDPVRVDGRLRISAKGARHDPVADPIENPMVRWTSEPIAVATIKIAPQAFETPEHMKEAEELSFDPWHALAAHRPIGGINRARREVYPASLTLRQSSAAV